MNMNAAGAPEQTTRKPRKKPSPLPRLTMAGAGLVLMERLGPTEIRRRLWHILPGFLPFLLWWFPHADPLSPTLRGIMGAIGVVLAAAVFVYYRRIARPLDEDRLAAVLGYAGSVMGTLILFPAHAELGLTVLAVLAFGDGWATLAGRLVGGPRLPWNRGKTFAGLIAFVTVGAPLGALVYWGEPYFNPESSGPTVSFSTGLLCAGFATLAAALEESVPSRINDNIRVGITAAASVTAMHAVLVGL